MGRIYIFTGKGGVGKSSIASAHAIKSAEEGEKTLLVSTDMAHNLGDIFETEIGKEPRKVMDNLDIYEIDPEYVMEHDFADITACITKMLSGTANSSMEELGMMPGMEELFSLLKIADLHEENAYERIIVDCAPTGETLSLLKFPELLSWYMEKFFPIGRVAMRVLAPISQQFFKMELPDKTAMNDIERLYLKLGRLQELLKDREVTSVRLVTMPEKMVVEETKRSYMYMNLYNFNIDGLYINRMLPSDISNAFFTKWIQIQAEYVRQLEESFTALPIYHIPWYDEEVRGIGAVKRICKDGLTDEALFHTKNITQREIFEQTKNGYELKVFLPEVKKEELEVYQSNTDVVIKIGNYKRNIPLPNVLRNCEIAGAKLQEEKLSIKFEQRLE